MTDVRAKTTTWTPRELRTFENSRGDVLRETVDGRWLDANEETGATTGEGDWPVGTDGVELDGCLTGRGLAAWERELIENA